MVLMGFEFVPLGTTETRNATQINPVPTGREVISTKPRRCFYACIGLTGLVLAYIPVGPMY